ncbi:MAG TPA: hypothetical protein VNJ08_04050 [Bacteriovoracaceae bacterium]|nr:hypothetical protein [Bacteriovoracaceae bacterium]
MLGDKAGRNPGLKVEFIGLHGKVLHLEENLAPKSPTVKVEFSNESATYIRAKIIYTVKGEKENMSYYAWAQPWWKK